MQNKGYRYDVLAVLVLGRKDIDHLTRLANGHYDGQCRAAANRGGFIYGWNNQLEFTPGHEQIEVCVTWNQVDLICKILEQEGLYQDREITVQLDWWNLLQAMTEEGKRVNPQV